MSYECYLSVFVIVIRLVMTAVCVPPVSVMSASDRPTVPFSQTLPSDASDVSFSAGGKPSLPDKQPADKQPADKQPADKWRRGNFTAAISQR